MRTRLHPGPIRLASLVLLLLFGFAGPGLAEEEGPTPAARYAELAGGLPAPTPDKGFSFDGVIKIDGKTIGTTTIRARARVGDETAGEDRAAFWVVEETMTAAEGRFRREFEALIDGQLRPIRGAVRSKHPQHGDLDLTWEREEGSFQIVKKVTQGDETKESTEALLWKDLSTTSFSSLILFCRQTLPAKGSYEVTIFEPDPDEGEEPLVKATWQTGEQGEWRGQKAWIVKGLKGANSMEMGLAVDDLAFLGTRLTNGKTGTVASFEPKPEPKPDEAAKPASPFEEPAKSAKRAALQAGLALATGDLTLLEEAIHWPSVYGVAKADYEKRTEGKEGADPFPDTDGFRAQLMKQMEGSLTKRPRPMIEGVLKMIEGALQEEALESGVVRVTFPDLFQSLTLDVGEHDGVWKLVRLPSSPRQDSSK